MIAAGVVERIREMLASGELSQRKIARRAGVSRGTVNAIAQGRRPDRPAQRPSPDADFTPRTGPPVRCPQCGGMVQMPCLLCHVRAIRRHAQPAGSRATCRHHGG